MLHKDPSLISPDTIALIRQLQAMPVLKEFYLVGGTALTLQLGHRNSIDIDLFTQDDFNTDELMEYLKKEYSIVEKFRGKNTLITFINEIKVDLLGTYCY